MQIIINANKTIAAVCGTQKNTEGREMRPSVYMIQSRVDDGLLLYNTLTGELLLLENGQDPDEASVRKVLTEKWYYVPSDFDELRFFGQVQSAAELLAPKSDVLTGFTIFTTTDCNARCFYCFERGAKSLSMSDKTAHDTASFIINSCGGKKVELRWFGGEPLYNSRAIDIISEDIRIAGLEYDSMMVSNGYLFDEDTVKKAKELWKLKSVQITLDGTETIYNNTKNYIYGRIDSAYRTVLRNIEKLLEAGIGVNIRLNLNSANSDDLMRLADELKDRFNGMDGLFVFPVLLYDYVGKGHGFAASAEAYYALDKLKEKLLRLGLSDPAVLQQGYRVNQCKASNDHCVTVLPDGHLGKCEHHLDDDFIGSIYDGITDIFLVNAWKERKTPGVLCKSCPVYPICSVLLKKCPSNQRDCTPDHRDRYIASLKTAMINTFNKYKRSGEPVK